MPSPSVNDQEQKPSSLEELREKIANAYMTPWFNQVVSGQWNEKTTISVKEKQIDAVISLFRSHMEAVIDNIVKGPRDSWIQYDKKNDNFAHGFAIAQKMIEDRAKSYLEGEK